MRSETARGARGRRMGALVCAWLIAVVCGSGPAGAQTPDGVAARDTVVVPLLVRGMPDSLLLGEPFSLEASIPRGGLTAITLETPARELEPFEVAGWQRGLDRGDTATVRLTLRAFEVGTLTLPALRVAGETVAGELCIATGDSSTVQVVSIVPEDATDLLDIHEAIAPETPRPLWPWLLGGAILAAAVAAWLLMRRRRALGDGEHVYAARPAHEIALDALRALGDGPLARSGPWKPFYTELTDVVRAYVARRYGVDAMDMTTTETLRSVEPVGIDDDARDALRRVLEAADHVKFAKGEPAEGAPRSHLHEAVRFVRLSTPRSEEPAPEPSTAVAGGSRA